MSSFHPWQRLLLVAVLVAPLALTSGCGIFSPDEVDDGPGTGEPPAPYPLATTQDILVSNFVRAYNERNYEKYEAMLDEQFLFYLSDEDIAAGAEARFDRARDLQATWNMFKGEPGETPDGEVQPPIRSIDLKLIPEAAASWTDQVGQDFLGTTMRRYEVDMTVEYTDSSISAVTGLQEFYAVAAAHDNGDGTQTPIYKLKFWRDLGKEGL